MSRPGVKSSKSHHVGFTYLAYTEKKDSFLILLSRLKQIESYPLLRQPYKAKYYEMMTCSTAMYGKKQPVMLNLVR